MSWLGRLNPRGLGSRTNRSASASSPCTADPETCLMVFENHWRQLSWVLEQHDPSSSSDDLTAVRNHTDQMLCLLAEERPLEGSGEGTLPPAGPLLQRVVRENILQRLVQWHLHRPAGLDSDTQGALLKLFEMLIGQSQQPLLQHPAILQPLLSLLGACADPQLGGCPPAMENSLVLLLNQVCVSMARQPAVLELLFHSAAAQQGPTNLLIFSLLVPFIHRDGAIGQQARDALLLVMAASAGNEAVARYIAENSYFCPVLATGLSALYSSLPRKMEVHGDDWHALRREDWVGVASLVLFMNSLEFCNAVVQVAHPLVRSQLLDYLHNGFLVPVMGPALHKSSVDEMIASTAYLDLFLRSVTETALLKTFLRFILMHRHDNDTILDTLLTRISSNSRLCMVSLSLFRTLLSLNCEDLMLQLVLRYLLPCNHVMLSQRRAVRETDLYGKSADKFLSLIPDCCRLTSALPGDWEDEPMYWGKGDHGISSPGAESPSPAPPTPSRFGPPPSKPSTPSRLALFIRRESSGGGGGPSSSSPTSEMVPSSPRSRAGSGNTGPLSPDSPMHQQDGGGGVPEGLDWEQGYLDYLRDARRGIEHCSWACRLWSAPYDGEDPSPSSASPPPPPPSANPSLAMVPEHFSFQQEKGSSPRQQRAAVVASARSEWSSWERDSGEWDVTIGKNNCISLTPRSKKRSLQREELHPASSPPPTLSSSSFITPVSSATQLPAPRQVVYNGTRVPGDGCCGDTQDGGMEVKKVKRDPATCLSSVPSDQNGSQGSVCSAQPRGAQTSMTREVGGGGEHPAPSRLQHPPNSQPSHQASNPPPSHQAPIPQASHQAPISKPSDEVPNPQPSDEVPNPQPLHQSPNPQSSITQQLLRPSTSDISSTPHTHLPNTSPANNSTTTPTGTSLGIGLSSQGLKSVESLIEELLEQGPGDPPPSGEFNGQGISIEAFTQELRELEDRVRERRGPQALEEPSHDPALSMATQEEEADPDLSLAGGETVEESREETVGEARGESSALGVLSPARPLGQAASQPYTGPFMMVVFSKLENMLQNSLYVNILLTGIVSQLACYPQPLLRSFLLNTNMVFQPSVKSLIQVLGSVKNRIESFAVSHEDFPAMLRKAQRYLAARGKLEWSEGHQPLRRSDSIVKSRKPSLGDLLLRHTNSPTRARHAAQLALAHVRDGSQSLHSALFRGGAGSGAMGLEKQAEALRVKNAVYCAVIFSEFLKELSALAQEHAVAMPYPCGQEMEE